MHAPRRPLASLFILLLVATGCGKKEPPMAPATALSRPVVTLTLHNGRVLAPQAAITERGAIPGVFVLDPQQTARFRMVRTGKTADGRVEVLSGLTGDETLVTGDLRDIRDGSPVVAVRSDK
jgi:hypothetical protein